MEVHVVANTPRLKLDLAQHVPIHSRVATMDEVLKIAKTGNHSEKTQVVRRLT